MAAGPVEILREATPEAVQQINKLLAQLSPTLQPINEADLNKIIQATTMFIVRSDAVIVGIASIVIAFVPGGLAGFLESVVVDDNYRGQGIGEQLVKAAMELAAQRRVTRIDLTTSDRRPAAKRLYQRLGFMQRDTNVYRYRPEFS